MILAIDAGTTGVTALLVSHELKILSEAGTDFPQSFPKPSWVEHDPNEIWKAVRASIQKALEGLDSKKISTIGITNQRETICFWDRNTLEPLAPAIVWQDRRTSDMCEALKARGLGDLIRSETGLLLDPYFSGTKIKWALDNWGDVKKAYNEGRLHVGTVDSFLIAKLTAGKSHVTDPSNASRTLVMNIKRRSWDTDLCRLLEVPKDILPEILPSSGKFGETRGLDFLPDGISITGALGDQQSALLGQACVRKGSAKCTYGTGAFLLMNTGMDPVFSKHSLLTSVAWDLGPHGVNYVIEGSTFVAGAAVQWLKEGLGLIEHSADIEPLAASVSSSEGVTFVPALTGLGAPYWKPDATGLFTGITRGSTKAHFARAVLEGIAFQVSDVLLAMEKDLGDDLKIVHVDGGAAANNLLMQIQSNLLQTPLKRPKFLETTSLGAVFAAGLGTGVWGTLESIEKAWKLDHEFKPYFTPDQTKKERERWSKAIQKACLS
jgi:glycerol kinase